MADEWWRAEVDRRVAAGQVTVLPRATWTYAPPPPRPPTVVVPQIGTIREKIVVMANGTNSGSAIARALRMSRPALAYHLRVLRGQGVEVPLPPRVPQKRGASQ